jgi:replication factor C subunit 3/5
VDDALKPQIIHWAAHYVSSLLVYSANDQELRMRLGAKKIFHIEAFIAKVMR